MRRASFLQLGLFAIVAAAITAAVAYAIPWLGEDASRQAGRIIFVFWFVEWISIVIFAIVAAVLVYAAWKFRAKPDDLSDGPPIHGNTAIEIAWTAIPFLLVTAIAVVSAIVLSKNSRAGTDPLKITVIGQQFSWTFVYPNGQTFSYLRLPLKRNVLLKLESRDVLHSFWVPQMFQKQDAVPGLPTHLVITPTRTGTFPVICVELCGLGHSTMRSQAVVMTQAAYATWYKSTTAPAGGGGGGAAVGLATFNKNGCGACHTFTPAKATGKVGPDLDKLKQEAAAANQPLEAFIRESIVDPNKYIAPGYQPNVMPPTFGQSIPPAQLDALVQYLASNAK